MSSKITSIREGCLEIIKMPLGMYKANCYILKENGEALIIDPGFHPNQVIEAIGDFDVVGIVLTHGHIDHVTAATALYERYGMPILIHAADVELLHTRRRIPSAYRIVFSAPTESLEIPYTDIGHYSLHIFETPGHTPGSVCIGYKGHLFTGDTLFRGTIGRTESYLGDADAMEGTIRYLRAFSPQWRVHPGHGPDTTLQKEFDSNPALQV